MNLGLGLGLPFSRVAGPYFVGPLDDYTAGLTAAYDLKRRLFSSYTGHAFTARADRAGQPTLEVPFKADGTWDTDALLSFAGSDSVYVTEVPIQFGSLPSLAQAVAASQPRIVNAGVLEDAGAFFVNTTTKLLEVAFGDITDFLGASQGQIIYRQRTPAAAGWRPLASTVGGLLAFSPFVGFAFFDYGTAGRINGTYPAGADDVVVDVSMEHFSTTGTINIDGSVVVTAAQADALTSGAGSLQVGQASDCWLSSLVFWNTCDATLAAERRTALA
jgi:hypothetical protein